MNSPHVQFIEEIKNRLKVLNPIKIILFGSNAYGSADVDSDIDLIVVLNKEKVANSFKEKMADIIAVRKLLSDINRQVALDVLVYSKIEWQNFFGFSEFL